MVVAGLRLQAFLFGVVGLWLLALIPSAVITALKGRWLLFAVGWLTLGLPWIIGAVALAPPDSWWAGRLYDEEKLARATDPVRHPRPRLTLVAWVGCTIALIAVLGLFAARPTPILGVSGEKGTTTSSAAASATGWSSMTSAVGRRLV